jgi:hypothetical protein
VKFVRHAKIASVTWKLETKRAPRSPQIWLSFIGSGPGIIGVLVMVNGYLLFCQFLTFDAQNHN